MTSETFFFFFTLLWKIGIELREMQSAQIMSWKQTREREAQSTPALKSQVTINNLDIIISFAHASIRILPHPTPTEKRNSHTGVTSLSLDVAKVEMKCQVQMRNKKKREEERIF